MTTVQWPKDNDKKRPKRSGKNEKKNLAPLPIRIPQFPYGLTCEQSQSSKARCGTVAAQAMARPHETI